MAKLKFNLLELTSKRIFLDKLMPSGTLNEFLPPTLSGEMTMSIYDEWTNCQTRWTPGDLKDLERQVESRKAELKAVKEAVGAVKEEISNVTSHVAHLKDSVNQERQSGAAKLAQIAALENDIAFMQQRLTEFAERVRPLTKGLVRCGSCEDSGSVVGEVLGIRSAEELRAELAELSAAEAKKRAVLEGHKNSLTDLSRLLHHHTDDLVRLQTDQSRLSSLLTLKQRQKAENADADLEELCVWYRGLVESVSELTRMQFEMIRPDYILVTFKTSSANVNPATTLPVHLNVDPQTGRLLAAQIGTTTTANSATWKDLCELAVENNDIPSLLHSIQLRI